MKKLYVAAIQFIVAFFLLFTWLAWAAPIFALLGIAVLIWGVETGPDTWAWKWTLKKA